jgi:uncharacterized protein (TIGR00730 family)
MTPGPMADHPHTDDEALLAQAEVDADDVRLDAIRREFDLGFDALADLGPAVSVFGSARTEPGSAEYESGRAAARCFGAHGFAVITGGGPGIMEAANRGAQEAGAVSVGCNIELPFEQHANRYLDIDLTFGHFYVRKVMFVRYAQAFVVFPGGFGTLDELFEALTLIQTRKIRQFPVVLMGESYWRGLMEWVEAELLAKGRISPGDLRLVRVIDDPEEACAAIQSEAAQPGEIGAPGP